MYNYNNQLAFAKKETKFIRVLGFIPLVKHTYVLQRMKI
jgi:hypothetical protein